MVKQIVNMMITLFCLSISMDAIAQYSTEGLDMDQNNLSWFDQQLGVESSPLIVGTYPQIYLYGNSHPFYRDMAGEIGELSYCGEVFSDIKVLHNIHESYLMIVHPERIENQYICLNQNQVEWFNVHSGYFRNYFDQDGRKGYYKILAENNAFSYVSKRTKLKVIDSQTKLITFKEHEDYYIFMGQETFSAQRKSQFIKIFPEHKKEIKLFTKENSLKIRPKNESDMVRLANYCTELTATK